MFECARIIFADRVVYKRQSIREFLSSPFIPLLLGEFTRARRDALYHCARIISDSLVKRRASQSRRSIDRAREDKGARARARSRGMNTEIDSAKRARMMTERKARRGT